MRKTLVVLLVAAIAVSVAAPSSMAKKKKKERAAEATYLSGNLFGAVTSGTPCTTECARFEVKAGEKFVDLHFADASGQAVYASVYAYGYTDGTDSHDHVCGETDSPIALSPGLKELVVVLETSGGVNAGCNGPPTRGTVHATFSNLP